MLLFLPDSHCVPCCSDYMYMPTFNRMHIIVRSRKPTKNTHTELWMLIHYILYTRARVNSRAREFAESLDYIRRIR